MFRRFILGRSVGTEDINHQIASDIKLEVICPLKGTRMKGDKIANNNLMNAIQATPNR